MGDNGPQNVHNHHIPLSKPSVWTGYCAGSSTEGPNQPQQPQERSSRSLFEQDQTPQTLQLCLLSVLIESINNLNELYGHMFGELGLQSRHFSVKIDDKIELTISNLANLNQKIQEKLDHSQNFQQNDEKNQQILSPLSNFPHNVQNGPPQPNFCHIRNSDDISNKIPLEDLNQAYTPLISLPTAVHDFYMGRKTLQELCILLDPGLLALKSSLDPFSNSQMTPNSLTSLISTSEDVGDGGGTALRSKRGTSKATKSQMSQNEPSQAQMSLQLQSNRKKTHQESFRRQYRYRLSQLFGIVMGFSTLELSLLNSKKNWTQTLTYSISQDISLVPTVFTTWVNPNGFDWRGMVGRNGLNLARNGQNGQVLQNSGQNGQNLAKNGQNDTNQTGTELETLGALDTTCIVPFSRVDDNSVQFSTNYYNSVQFSTNSLDFSDFSVNFEDFDDLDVLDVPLPKFEV
jgi:hypothetical protein